MSCAQARKVWARLSVKQRMVLEEIDDKICARLTLIVVIDIATRMPLAWVLSDQPGAEATLEALRMATRDKTREKTIYGCTLEPMTAMAIGHIKNDNGSGLRNARVKAALLGCGVTNTDARAHAATDKPYVERIFGTNEPVFVKLIEGYTGRKAGDLTGYDAVASALLITHELYAEITRFMIDEYPAMRHYGHGLFGKRPIEVAKQINASRGHWGRMDANERRIHLGWEDKSAINGEGVRVFGGLWFSSDELQEVDGYSGKVTVYVDPDDLNAATVIIPGHHRPVEVAIQNTVFADMTLPEVLDLMAEARREDHQKTEFYEDHLARIRLDRHARLRKLAQERKIPRNFMTVEEAKRKARDVFAGARVLYSQPISGTVSIEDMTTFGDDVQVFSLDGNNDVIEGFAATEEKPDGIAENTSEVPAARPPEKSELSKENGPSASDPSENPDSRLLQPKNVKDIK